MPCDKIDELCGKRYDVYKNVADIMTKLLIFTPELRFHSKYM